MISHPDYCNSLPRSLPLPLLPPYRLLSTQGPDQASPTAKDESSPWPARPSCPSPLLLWPHLLLTSPHSLHCRHPGLLAILPTRQRCSCLRPFGLTFSYAPSPRLSSARLTSSTIPGPRKCFLLGETFPDHPNSKCNHHLLHLWTCMPSSSLFFSQSLPTSDMLNILLLCNIIQTSQGHGLLFLLFTVVSSVPRIGKY